MPCGKERPRYKSIFQGITEVEHAATKIQASFRGNKARTTGTDYHIDNEMERLQAELAELERQSTNIGGIDIWTKNLPANETAMEQTLAPNNPTMSRFIAPNGMTKVIKASAAEKRLSKCKLVKFRRG